MASGAGECVPFRWRSTECDERTAPVAHAGKNLPRTARLTPLIIAQRRVKAVSVKKKPIFSFLSFFLFLRESLKMKFKRIIGLRHVARHEQRRLFQVFPYNFFFFKFKKKL